PSRKNSIVRWSHPSRRSIWLRRAELKSGRIALRSQEKPIRSRSRFSEISANLSEFYRRPGRFNGRLAPAVHRDIHRARIHSDGGPKAALNVTTLVGDQCVMAHAAHPAIAASCTSAFPRQRVKQAEGGRG